MTSRHALGLSTALLVPSFLILACGSSVAVPNGSGGGSSSSSSGGTSTGGTTTGAGGTSTGTGGSAACGAIPSEIGCLAAFPECVPVYDDKCCPSCDPTGGCADCVDIHFHHCAPVGMACIKTPCGVAPPWACAGAEANCAIDPGGSTTPCHTVPGCTAGYCSLDTTCKTDPVCVPVTKGSCTALCDGIPPPCPAGTVAESDGFCYTGLCIPADVCAQ